MNSLKWVSLLALVAFAGCKNQKLGNSSGCQEDKDCGAPASAYRCETQTGVCYCRTDVACPGSQFCNGLGFCQDRAGCQTNLDCNDSTTYCDTASGQCIPLGRCSSDLQCDLGKVCNLTTSACVDGCHTNGDCPGSSCRCGNAACTCSGTTADELARCDVGVCDQNFCADQTFCKFGESCGTEPDSGTYPMCFSDYDPDYRPYCDGCTFGGGTSICGNGPNFCLIDTRHPGNQYCGADCSSGQSCPRGYACQDVIVVLSQWACTRSNPTCPVNPSVPCGPDAGCPRGGTCVTQPGFETGSCAPGCSIDEGDQEGFCSCLVDNDCAQDACSGGHCTVSQRLCVNDDDCRAIHCVDYASAGGCLIGQNCAPSDGLSCNDVRQ
jgi:hypothetical protein